MSAIFSSIYLQLVDILIEHDADLQLSKAVAKEFGNERPKLTDTERRERSQYKSAYPAPGMTRALVDLGHDLVTESTYSDIVHARNLPEAPKNQETYKQVRYRDLTQHYYIIKFAGCTTAEASMAEAARQKRGLQVQTAHVRPMRLSRR